MSRQRAKFFNTLVTTIAFLGMGLPLNSLLLDKAAMAQSLIPNKATYGPVTLTNFTLNNNSNVVIVNPEEKINGFTNYTYDNGQGGSINQIIVGIGGQYNAQACIYNGSTQGSGSSSFTLTAPNVPGIYYIRFRYAQAFGCQQGALGWWRIDRVPTPEANIGIIIVREPTSI
ncbi:MAG: hypothetical protein V7K92_24690 [Nostoc sp.]|uniref:hypothetical protein n=1 Tax=Nostoc sp. TaxID=1180 RepID=UPI002FF23B72